MTAASPQERAEIKRLTARVQELEQALVAEQQRADDLESQRNAARNTVETQQVEFQAWRLNPNNGRWERRRPIRDVGGGL